jgi:hypothetical protein
MAISRPLFRNMWHHFIVIYGDGKVPSVGDKIGGKVKENINLGLKSPELGFTNACALRMSYSLNRSGAIVQKGVWKSVSGVDKNQYIYRVSDLVKFLKKIFGEPDKVVKNPKPSDFSGMKGILVFGVKGWSDATGHATLWDGSICSDKCHFPVSIESSIWLLK